MSTPDVVERSFACRCGARYGATTFAELTPVRVIDTREIASLVVRWPDNMVVDVRACASCQAPIARLSRCGESR